MVAGLHAVLVVYMLSFGIGGRKEVLCDKAVYLHTNELLVEVESYARIRAASRDC